MALTKVNRGGLNTGVSDASNATFLTVDSSEQAVIKSEGGAVTTSVQQGLVKAWDHYDQKGDSGSTQVFDDFNISTVTDSAEGRSIHNFSNNMSNNYSSTTGIAIDNGTVNLFVSGPETTVSSSSIKVTCLTAGDTADDPDGLMTMTCGDLA